MKRILTLLSMLAITGVMAQESRIITGRIFDGDKPLEDVKIHRGDETNPIFTDAEGAYGIEAIPGDIIHYSYTGMKEYRVRVEDVTEFLNLIMIPDVQELDEVTVSRKRKKSQQELAYEYRTNTNLIRTAFGILDVRRTPVNVLMVTEDEIMPIGLNILDVIRNRYPGIQAFGDFQQGGIITSRGRGSISNPRGVIWDIDGQVFLNTPLWLDVNNIKRMAIINALAYNARYGAIGGSGVIIINTVSGEAAMPKTGDLARLRNNYITDDIPDADDLTLDAPSYISDLKKANSLEDAVSIYESYKPKYSASPYFFLDAYSHFASRQGGDEIASTILEENRDRFSHNPVLMKGLAYLMEEQGAYDKALEVYKEIFIMRPHYSQSYLDMARAYREVGEISKSAAMFARYKYLIEEGFITQTKDFWKVLQHESDNLLALEGRRIGQRVRNILTDPYVEGTTRVVFEWNDSEAEFDLQFVNPEGQFFTWNHSFAANEERITDEKDNGYSITEYVVDQNLPGQWTVNVKYLGNKSLTPTYLKVTVYTSYGERSQRKQTRTYKLLLKGVNQRLFSFENPGRVSAN